MLSLSGPGRSNSLAFLLEAVMSAGTWVVERLFVNAVYAIGDLAFQRHELFLTGRIMEGFHEKRGMQTAWNHRFWRQTNKTVT